MKFPLRRQLEGVDCGPTCIQMVAAYYGKNIPLTQLKENCNVTRLGISLKDVIGGCQKIGIKAVAARLKKEDLGSMPLPAILYWKQEHYVVLYKVVKWKGKSIFYIADPNYGKTKLVEDLFIEAWAPDGHKGIGLVLEPTSSFFDLHDTKERMSQKVVSFFRTFKFLSGHRQALIYVLLLSIATFVCSLFIPIFLQKIIDDGVGLKDMNLVILLLCGQLSLFAGSQIAGFVNNYILYKTGLTVGLKISTQFIHKLVHLPICFFDTKLGTDLLQRLNDEEKIRNFLTYTISSLLFVALNLIIYSFVLMYYNIYIFLLFAVFSIVSVVLTKMLLEARKFLNYALFGSWSKKKNIENELVYGMMEIKMNAAHNLFLSQWRKVQDTINKQLLKSQYYESSIASGTSFLNSLRDIIITGGCAYFVIQGDMTIGIMMTVTYILGQLSGAINQVADYGKTSQDSNLAFERMEEILKVPDENRGRSKALSLSSFCKGFVLSDLSFKYAGSFNPYVLNEINIIIPAQKVTAIVGASGSGKTTLLKLLLAFYYPQKGDLYIDDLKMNRIDSDEWRKKCGAVMQDGYIFSDSIANNISLADDNPDWERLKEAAGIACIDEFINRLPMGYHTKIGKSGIDLSGGQKQRILIARAIYKNPEFIFFDEATSSLDASNERAIMENLKGFYNHRTVIIIAHRLSTVKDADNIIVLDQGRVVEQGTHLQLASLQGKYYELVKNQLELGQ